MQKKPHISPNSNANLQKWSRNTTLIVGDSILPGIGERRISKIDRKNQSQKLSWSYDQ